MKKELIIRNTIIFLVTCLSTVASGTYLGKENLMVGVFVFIMSLFILNKNFTGNPFKVAFKVISLTLFIGIFPYLANLNMYTGIFINFFAIFVMLYLLVYNYKKTIYFPFLMGYTLFLSSHVSEKGFPLRVLGLGLVGVFAFLIQILINRKKAGKFYIKSLKGMISSLEEILDSIITEKDYSQSLKNFNNYSSSWNNNIFENRDNSFYLNDREHVELNLISSLEKLEHHLEKIQIDDSKIYILSKFKNIVSKFKDYEKSEDDFNSINKEIYNLISESRELKPNSYLLFELIESLYIINSLLKDLNEIDYKKVKLNQEERKIELKNFRKILINNLNKHSVRFTFAFRTAFLLSVTYFIIQYFHIRNGVWMLYSISTISQLYDDNVKLRAIHRIKGTIIGALAFFFLFSVFPELSARLVIILIAVYITPFMKAYDKSMICLTILILGLAAMSSPDTQVLTIDRILYSFIGAIIAYVGSKIIFHYNIEKETKILVEKYYDLGVSAIDIILSVAHDEDAKAKFKNLVLLAPIIENKLLLSNTVLDNEKLNEFIKEERNIINSLNYILNKVEYGDSTLQENRVERLNNLSNMTKELEKRCYNCNNCTKDTVIDSLKHHFEDIEKISERLIYVTICEVILSNKTCLDIKNQLLL